VWDLTFRLWIAASGGAATKRRQRLPQSRLPETLAISNDMAQAIARFGSPAR
jgi:hypothetical protein